MALTETAHRSVAANEKLDWVGSIPFFALHAIALGLAIHVGATWQLVLLAVAMYYVRMWAVTTGYHRYFSHRTFQTNRVFQFVLALVATTAAQKGPLWWAAHHRHHHRASDQPDDIHSPVQRGFWWSHVGWILCGKYSETRFDQIKDFARYPELRWLNKYHLVPPTALALVLLLVGGLPALTWGFLVSTVLLWHGTFTINSLSHVFGKKRYKATDDSRNNWLLAIITMGEGWHNNHHYHQNTANQGWFWWEIDLSYYVLRVLAVFGVVKHLKTPPDSVKYAHLSYTEEDRAALAKPLPRAFRAPQVHVPLHVPLHVPEAVRHAGEVVRDAVQHAAESARAGASPQPVLKRR